MVTDIRARDRTGLQSYGALFASRHAKAFFAASVPGRFGVAMTSLAVIVFTQTVVGSFAVAGLAASVLAITNAVLAPVSARLARRLGQPPVLAVSGITTAIAAVTMTVAGVERNPFWLLASVVLLGASMPQIGAVAISRWTSLFQDPARLRTAFAVESVATEVTFLAGPAILSGAVALYGAAVAPGFAIGLIAVSALLLAGARSSAPSPSPAGSHVTLRPGRALALVFAASGCMGVFFGASQVSVIASATADGSAAIATAVYGTMSITSMLSGFVYGVLRRPISRAAFDLAVAFTGLAVTSTLLVFAHDLLPLIVLLLIDGVFVAPAIINIGVLMQRDTPQARTHQTFTVLASVQGLGVALGAAAAGLLTDAIGATAGFAAPAVAAAAAIALAAGARPRALR